MRRLAITRLLLAAAITLLVLPMAWCYTLLPVMIVPEFHYLASVALIAGIAATFFLTRDLGQSLTNIRWTRWVVIGVATGWVLSFGILAWLMIVPSVWLPAFTMLFLLSTIWLPCTAWLGYSGSIPRSKWLLLGCFVALGGLFPALVRVQELTGDLKVEFVWRTAGRKDFVGKPQEVVAATPSSIGPIGPDDSPQFFGPQRNGTWQNLRLVDWNDAPPVEIWRREVGPGWSSIAVAGGYCFTQEQRGDEECVTCYRLTDGSPVWTHTDKTRFVSSMGGDGPRATPTINNGHVYSVGATGKLNCLEAATGKRVWSVDLLNEFGGENLMHGVCASPLVDGDRVYVCPPAEGAPTLAAYHRESGAKLWTGGAQRASYNSPSIWDVGGMRQVIVHNCKGLAGHDPANGNQLWFFEWTNNAQTNGEGINCSQPVLDAAGPGTVLITTGYGTGAVLARVKRDGPDHWVAEESWKSPKRSLKTKFTSAVVFENNAYALDDGILACVDVVTGKLRWKDGRYQHGQVILAGDRLVVQAESGELVMIEPSPTGLKEVGRVSALSDKTWSVPVIAGRHLLVRNDREMACYELTGR